MLVWTLSSVSRCPSSAPTLWFFIYAPRIRNGSLINECKIRFCTLRTPDPGRDHGGSSQLKFKTMQCAHHLRLGLFDRVDCLDSLSLKYEAESSRVGRRPNGKQNTHSLIAIPLYSHSLTFSPTLPRSHFLFRQTTNYTTFASHQVFISLFPVELLSLKSLSS